MMTSVISLLEKNAADHPDRIALSDTDGSLTYSEYRAEAVSVGTYLAERFGAGGSRPVAVLCDRSILPIVAFLGCLYSGNYYVPIDLALPEYRIKLILDDISPVCISGVQV